MIFSRVLYFERNERKSEKKNLLGLWFRFRRKLLFIRFGFFFPFSVMYMFEFEYTLVLFIIGYHDILSLVRPNTNEYE